ncbi:MAG: SDR family oxidoreductase [Candidatus Doudnabacteria bacterium]|nr:SDR family oxidoreductase [Candidatus Doudnabacteria bacterium]
MELRNKVVVITGGSRGLGKALAKEFAKQGGKVIICASTQADLDKAAAEMGVRAYQVDVTKENEVIALGDFVVKEYGRIEVWINNAGISQARSRIEDIDLNQTRKSMEVNLFGTIYGSRTALRIMKKQGAGTIVNIVSSSALVGRPNSAGYASTKWAARGFTESLRMACEPGGILVMAVHPGGIKTGIFKGKLPEEYESFMEPGYVAKKIVENLQSEKPSQELIVNK